MHKYSYELSASYRKETHFGNNYLPPTPFSPKKHSISFHLLYKPVSSYHRGHSNTFIPNKNIQIPSNSQSNTHRNHIQCSLYPSRSGLKIKERSPRPEYMPPWRPPQQNSVQNRLQILHDLGQRTEQAIRGMNFQAKNKGYSPIRRIDHQHFNQTRDDLKRQFSFKDISLPVQHKARSQFIQNEQPIEIEPLGSKQSMLNMTIMNHPRKSAQTSLTVAKLSSLQQRIRSTVQPFFNK